MLTFLPVLTLGVKRTKQNKKERNVLEHIKGWLCLVGHGVNGSLLTF